MRFFKGFETWQSRLRAGASLLGAAALLVACAWAFARYTDPDGVMDFALLLQVCGMPAAIAPR